MANSSATGILVLLIVDNRTGVTPVRKTLHVGDPVVQTAKSREDSRVSPCLVERVDAALGSHGNSACHHQHQGKRKNRMVPLRNEPESEPGYLSRDKSNDLLRRYNSLPFGLIEK